MQIIELQEIDSTNNYAKNIARDVKDITVVWAHSQTSGKGRQGNVWASPVGNLYMTLILPELRIKKEDIGQLSFIASVAMAEVVEKIISPPCKVQLKWPNDVLIDGKKLSGILVETESNANWAIIGIGVNVASAPEGGISIKSLKGEIEVKDLMLALCAKIQELNRKEFRYIQHQWLAKAYKLNEEIKARLPNKTLYGIFRGIDEKGVLLLETDASTIVKINSGEVFL